MAYDTLVREVEHIYDHFYTARGAVIVKQRQQAAVDFYQALYREVTTTCENGREHLASCVEN